MNTSDILSMNNKFSIKHHCVIHEGKGGIPFISVENAYAKASIALLGGHILSFQPHGQKDLLWLSKTSVYKEGKPIRGGIPICWPWFGKHPSASDSPMHGFARTHFWELVSTDVIQNGYTQIRLLLTDNQQTLPLWDQRFLLEETITIGNELFVELKTTNNDVTPFTWTGALHTYFAIGNTNGIAINGFDSHEYFDKLDNMARKSQKELVRIDAPIDRIYIETMGDCVIEDHEWKRKITIAKRGSHSTVVWNPWKLEPGKFADIEQNDYLDFVCVETAVTATDAVTLKSGESHILSTELGIEGL
jgi:D-hexose-6-phosphate mutarotase